MVLAVQHGTAEVENGLNGLNLVLSLNLYTLNHTVIIVASILTIDIRKGNGLETPFNLYTSFASLILNKPETNIAHLSVVFMRKNVIQFMSIITM